MRIECPHCQEACDADESMVGQKAQCPACENEFIISSPKLRRSNQAELKPMTKMKTCPFCKETDLQIGATFCKHCQRNIAEAEKPFYNRKIGCAAPLGVAFVVLGIFFWPLWILAVLCFILAAVKK